MNVYVYRPTELAKMQRRFCRDIPLTVTVRELEDFIDTGVDINSYEGADVNLLIRMMRKFFSTYYFKPTHITCYEQVRLLEKLVKCALENGADPDDFVIYRVPFRCETVLHIALIGKQSWKMCRMLLSYGADVNAKYAKYGRKPVETVLTDTYSHSYSLVVESRRNCVIHMWQRMFVEAGANPMEVVVGGEEPGSVINRHVSMLDEVEEAFMIDFYIENSV